MKKTKFASLFLSLICALALSTVAFAADVSADAKTVTPADLLSMVAIDEPTTDTDVAYNVSDEVHPAADSEYPMLSDIPVISDNLLVDFIGEPNEPDSITPDAFTPVIVDGLTPVVTLPEEEPIPGPGPIESDELDPFRFPQDGDVVVLYDGVETGWYVDYLDFVWSVSVTEEVMRSYFHYSKYMTITLDLADGYSLLLEDENGKTMQLLNWQVGTGSFNYDYQTLHIESDYLDYILVVPGTCCYNITVGSTSNRFNLTLWAVRGEVATMNEYLGYDACYVTMFATYGGLIGELWAESPTQPELPEPPELPVPPMVALPEA